MSTERRTASGIAIAAALAFGLVLLAVLHGGAVVAWDHTVNAWMHAHQTSIGIKIWTVVSVLGLPGVWIVDGAVGLVLLCVRRWTLLVGWIVATGGGGLLDRGIKMAVHRPRPPYAGEEFLHSPSFPSGHALASAIAYLMLVVVIRHLVPLRRSQLLVLCSLAIALVLAIGFSRVYLAVHYPTDVLGGYCCGVAWSAAVTACIAGARTSGRQVPQ